MQVEGSGGGWWWRKTPVRVVAARTAGGGRFETSQIRFCWINLFSYRPNLAPGGSCKLWNSGKPSIFSIADSTKCALLRLFLKMPPFFVNLIQCGSLPQKDWYCEGHFIWELLPDRSIEQKGGGQSAGKWPRPTLLDSTDASLPSLGVVVTIVLLLLLLGILLLSLILSTSPIWADSSSISAANTLVAEVMRRALAKKTLNLDDYIKS